MAEIEDLSDKELYRSRHKAMEKPDFKIEGESRYPMKSSGKIYSIRKAFRAGCEHVWNTHVVPLQESLRIEREAHDKSMTENKALREEIERLKVEVLKEKFPEN